MTVQNISDLYSSEGEALFAKTPSSAAFANAFPIAWLANRDNRASSSFPWHTTDIRTALALARIHHHHGNSAEAQRYAQFALHLIKPPVASELVADLEALANAT